MRFYQVKLFIIMCFLVVGGQVFAQSKRKVTKKIDSNSIFEKVYNSLVEKPKWLSTEDVCPFDRIPNFETEVKYLSEGCSENAEMCLNKCKNNDGNACYSLALLIQVKKGLMQNQSEFLFLRSCKLGVTSGCTNRAAAILNLKEDDEKSVKCAADTFEKTCEKDDAWGCTMFGFALYQGKGRQKDSEKALNFLSKSCKNGDEDEACQTAKKLIEEIKKSQTIY